MKDAHCAPVTHPRWNAGMCPSWNPVPITRLALPPKPLATSFLSSVPRNLALWAPRLGGGEPLCPSAILPLPRLATLPSSSAPSAPVPYSAGTLGPPLRASRRSQSCCCRCEDCARPGARLMWHCPLCRWISWGRITDRGSVHFYLWGFLNRPPRGGPGHTPPRWTRL